ncbi:hypothetical protein [Alkalihalobacillus sp. AL-G]|uniref:hypothetical protein n=1 Tax=Alkalihalobacillus sp. AL-G TaxID=2926399 RepID=UPI00272BEF13|nr:hypothetical protein [Alkalihalobacillus sp. AL-G]WLD94302.1 hypothetical protein MOJ78_05255 [Alkalihalobacillus sp. AL-G]
MRKKLFSTLPLLMFLLIVGCRREDDNVYDADFQGAILEVKEDSIIVGEDDIDPEASYPTYVIIIDDKTKFSGEVERFEDLDKFVSQTEHPEHVIVHLWVIDKGKNNEIDKRVASKVIVEKE